MNTFQLMALGALVVIAAAAVIEFAVSGLRECLGAQERAPGGRSAYAVRGRSRSSKSDFETLLEKGPAADNRAAWWIRRK